MKTTFYISLKKDELFITLSLSLSLLEAKTFFCVCVLEDTPLEPIF